MTATADSAETDLRRTVANIQRQLDERTAERDEALARETAAAEVLRVINSSPGDLTPVFDAILEKAHSLCGATFGGLLLRTGDLFESVALRGEPQYVEAWRALGPAPPTEHNPVWRLMRGERYVQFADAMTAGTYRGVPALRHVIEIGGVRSLLLVPLRRDDQLIGVITASRSEVRPFSSQEIALLENFAAQAVVAIENARLITETREALAREAAMAEVLGVINSSPGNLAPVFDAMLEKALRFCDAAHGHIWQLEGEDARVVAVRGDAGFIDWMRQRGPARPTPGSALGRIVGGERIVYTVDATDQEVYRTDPYFRSFIDTAGIRTSVMVALHKDETVFGAITVHRREVRPFSDKQIALLQNFAAQAVIAMENARLITETQEALEQQTATAEVLQVINSSPGDLAPVFKIILEKAHRLCGAAYGSLQLYDGEMFRPVALRGYSEDFLKGMPEAYRASDRKAIQPLLDGVRLVQIDDWAGTDDAIGKTVVESEGIRTGLFVPLRKENALLGMITASRAEARPFAEKEIALLENFAAQAVIAMENARLITETQEALDRQTATAEVLQVINSSPGDLAPVFDVMIERAVRLCGADQGVLRTFDGETFPLAAIHGHDQAVVERVKQLGPIRIFGHLDPIARGERVVHIADVRESDTYRDHQIARERLDLAGVRTWLSVALQKEGALLGAFIVYRGVVRPFSEKEIALLQNFAAQAVIAIENARLITETREALEQQTATAEVLQVINASPGDLAPVFDAMLEKSLRLCEASFGSLIVHDGDLFWAEATYGGSPASNQFAREPRRAGPETGLGRLQRGEDFVEIADMADTDAYRSGDPRRRALVDLAGGRSYIAVALRKDGKLLGAISAYRQEVRPFTDKKIALLQTFADQAVIAMENARLITETREALEQQTATAEVLQVINASPGDLAPVFEAMLEKAMRLCGAVFGELRTYDGASFRTAATRGVPAAFVEYRANNPPAHGPGTGAARILAGERLIHDVDLMDSDAYRDGEPNRRALVKLGGVRTSLQVPLRKDDLVLGSISIYRQEVRAFSDKEIALLQNFAAQAVIAFENARLLDEIRQRQAELRVTFDNMADGVAMFDEKLHLAAWNKNFQELLDLPDAYFSEPHGFEDYIRYLVARGEFGAKADADAEMARLRARFHEHYSFERTRPDGRVIEVRHNPMSEGGFVLIYSDITERKRSEIAIREARDAAEGALGDLRAAQANLIQAEKMASLGQLTAGIAHEIKNPLNFVNNFASLSIELLDELKEETEPVVAALGDEKRAEIDDTMALLTGNLEKIAEHGKRADNIVKSMLEHSRGVSGERREVDLNALVEEALNLAYHGARAQDQGFNIALEHDYAPALKAIELAPQEMTRVFLNLFGNGFYAANKRVREIGGGSFRPTLSVATREDGDTVEVRVRDNGTGILPEIRDKLFQPFFTTKPTGEGTGLGLSISYDIITQQHGGTITVESEVGAYTEFTIRLPRRGAAQTGASA